MLEQVLGLLAHFTFSFVKNGARLSMEQKIGFATPLEAV
jgi:hypothetical protein